MNARSRTKLYVTAALVCALSGVGAAAVSAAVSHRASKRTGGLGPASEARAIARGPSTATRVFAADGLNARVLGDASGRCLALVRAHRESSTCGSFAEIDEGQSIAVADECGSSGQNRMTISGLAPEGSETVRLRFSDESHLDTSVEAGAFVFQGTNPGAEDPYPVGVQWRGSGGTDLGSAELPVEGDRFCIEPPEAPATP